MSLWTDYSNGPEIIAKIGVSQVAIRHSEIALHSPTGPPGIPHDKPLLAVVIAHRQHRMASLQRLRRLVGHRNDSCVRHGLTFETVINGKTEDERVAFGQATFQLTGVLG